MSIIQCDQGHYFDDSRDTECPYCKKLKTFIISEDDFGEKLTQYKVKDDDEAVMTESYGENVDENEKTIGIFDRDERNRLTAGWLVCTEGIERGASYTIYSGRNFVGRDEGMDVVLREDKGISRKRHFSLVYDPKSKKYYAVEGESVVYINSDPLSGSREIFENDVFQAGSSKYLFIPFCTGDRIWT